MAEAGDIENIREILGFAMNGGFYELIDDLKEKQVKQGRRIKELEEMVNTLNRSIAEKDECIAKVKKKVKTIEQGIAAKDEYVSKLKTRVDELSILPQESYQGATSWTKITHLLDLSKASHVSIDMPNTGILIADTIEFIIENVDPENLLLCLIGVMKQRVVTYKMKIGIDGFKIKKANYERGSYPDELVIKRAKKLVGVSGISASGFTQWCKCGGGADLQRLNQEYVRAEKDQRKTNIIDDEKKNNI